MEPMLKEAEDGRPGEQKQQVQAKKADKKWQDNQGAAAENARKRSESMQQQREDTGIEAQQQQEANESSADDNADTQTLGEGNNPAARSEGHGDSTNTAEAIHTLSGRSVGNRKGQGQHMRDAKYGRKKQISQKKVDMVEQIVKLRAENQELRVELQQLKQGTGTSIDQVNTDKHNTYTERSMGQALCPACAGYLLWLSEQHKRKTNDCLVASNDMESNNENEQFNVKDGERLDEGGEADIDNEVMILTSAVDTPLPDTPENERSERSKHETTQHTEGNMRNGKTNRITAHRSDEGRWTGEVQVSTNDHHSSREVSLRRGKDNEHSDQGLDGQTYRTNEWHNHEQERMHPYWREQRGSRQETGWRGQRWRTQRDKEIPPQSTAEERDEQNHHAQKPTIRYNGQRPKGIRRNRTTIILNSRLQGQQPQDMEGAGWKPWAERQQLIQETSQYTGSGYEQTRRNQPRPVNQRQEWRNSFQMRKGKRRGEWEQEVRQRPQRQWNRGYGNGNTIMTDRRWNEDAQWRPHEQGRRAQPTCEISQEQDREPEARARGQPLDQRNYSRVRRSCQQEWGAEAAQPEGRYDPLSVRHENEQGREDEAREDYPSHSRQHIQSRDTNQRRLVMEEETNQPPEQRRVYIRTENQEQQELAYDQLPREKEFHQTSKEQTRMKTWRERMGPQTGFWRQSRYLETMV